MSSRESVLVVAMLRISDNSGSMLFEDNGERVKDLKLILSRVAFAGSLFDDDGIQVRLMNTGFQGYQNLVLDGIRSEQQTEALIERVKWSGLTPLGSELRKQIIEPIVLDKARRGQLRKPVLIITITDGQPAGEDKDELYNTIRYAATELSRMPQYGRNAISFQFAQVGNDQAAKAYLAKLDSEREFGDLVDCTSSMIRSSNLDGAKRLIFSFQILRMNKKRWREPIRPLT